MTWGDGGTKLAELSLGWTAEGGCPYMGTLSLKELKVPRLRRPLAPLTGLLRSG